MAYINKAGILKRASDADVQELTNLDGTTEATNETLDTAISDADIIIDSELQGRFGSIMPFTPVPALIEIIAFHIVMYKLYAAVFIDNVPKTAKDNYEWALLKLAELKTGLLSLTDLTVTFTDARNTITNCKPEDKIFTRKILARQ